MPIEVEKDLRSVGKRQQVQPKPVVVEMVDPDRT